MRLQILVRPLAAALLTTSALALAACGEDAAGGSPAADADKKAQDAQLKFARCMREHGVDMPDPKPGERGIRLQPQAGVSQGTMQAADKACRKYLQDLKPREMSPEQEKKFRDAALAHARCMREHGVDMPDPTFGDNGTATIRIARGGVDLNSPKVKEAQEACDHLLPGLGGATRDGETP
jgi:hypothetical protein